jgi:Acetyltransferase (GNAT) domain
VEALVGEGKAQFARLFVDGGAVAAALILRSASSAWLWKIAYAERFARFSPGVQIVLDVTEQLLRDRTVKRADSCATADHPMIDHLWRERLVIADRLVSAGRGHVRELALVHRAEWLRLALIDCGKAVRDLLPRR